MVIMRTATRVLLLTVLCAASASAQKKTETTYVKEWLNFCGGSTFTTCASVRLSVTGVNVTMQAWNLSGGTYGGSAGAIIKNIALLNVPGGIFSGTSSSTSGTYWTGASTPYPFTITSTNSSTPSGSTGSIALSKSTLGQTTQNAAYVSGLASSCAATTAGLIPTGTRLWMTRTSGCTTTSIGTTSGADLVQYNFTVNQTFDPNAMGLGLGITAVDISSPLVTSTFEAYATPEPTSMILLGSGLAGLAGVARRRRKERAAVETEA